MKRVPAAVICLLLLLSIVLPAFGMGETSVVQLVHVEIKPSISIQTATAYSSFDKALAEAKSGDIIEVFAPVTLEKSVTIPENTDLTIVSGKKRDVTTVFGEKSFIATDLNAACQTMTKSFDGSMFVLGANSHVTFENITLNGNSRSGSKGGLVYAKNGSSLTLNRGVSLLHSKLGSSSYGGAIYAEKGASVSIAATQFSDNKATYGNDIYVEQKSDLAMDAAVQADVGYPPATSVSIDSVNLILSGEIGMVFHVTVPESFKNVTMEIFSKYGTPYSCPISNCDKDQDGKYLMTYYLGAIELAEPVTLTVYDGTGSVLATATETAQAYGKALIAGKTATEKEKNVVKALLNYGHYAQIACAEASGWTVGKEFKEITAVSSLTTDKKVFRPYKPLWKGEDPKVDSIGIQLHLDYTTEISFLISSVSQPTVTVDGRSVTPKPCEDGRYQVTVDGISALDLTKEHKTVINNKITITMSALSYCRLSFTNGSEKMQNAALALYEFYMATVAYHANS